MASRINLLTSAILLSVSAPAAFASNADYDLDALQALSLKDLLNVQVQTASLKHQSLLDAPANIKIVTDEQIKQRGYQNLIDILRDVPGFDFANYQDGAGEYTSHSINRGIGGTPGNVQLLIMVDGIVQNHIAFNWSQPWGNQQIFADIERIEIVQGPGSASYGANAYSGVIHFITKQAKQSSGQRLSVLTGEYGERSVQFMVNHQVSELSLQLAGRFSSRDGDSGLDSYDPAGYFANHLFPNYLTQQYVNDEYIVTGNNPLAGQYQLAGYNNQSDDNALRGKLVWQNPSKHILGITHFELGFNSWEQEQGLASYVTGFEYQTRDASYKKHHSAQHYYLDLDYQFSHQLELASRLWQRENTQEPDTGFKYSYRFVDLVKSYHSVSKQSAFEQQLNISKWHDIDWQLGYRLMRSEKMGQIVSLSDYQIGKQASTSSDWLIAEAGLGLDNYSEYPVEQVNEEALYAEAQGYITNKLNYTIGFRYDRSDAFGTTTNPRAAINFNASQNLVFKLLYGEAFREPSIFELNDEFRGNSSLKPEQIKTTELVSHYFYEQAEHQLDLKTAIYLSQEENRITLNIQDEDANMRFASASNVSYENAKHSDYWGLSFDANYSYKQSLTAYFNYHYSDGEQDLTTNALNHITDHKINWGVNYRLLPHLAVDLRANHLIGRNAPISNAYFSDNVENLSLYNLVVSAPNLNFSGVTLTPQLIVKNLFDKQYVLVGRQDGASDVNAYDINNNADPDGFTPAYHPQLGRTLAFQLLVSF